MHNPSDTQNLQDTTRRIAELYERVLGIRGVGGDDDFFVLGGTSLSAIRLLDLIAEEHGVQMPVKNFYRATAVADLAREVDRQRAEGSS